MNSDQLLRNLDDCAKASTHEPDAETINAAAEYIMQLERENHNQDLTIDEKNERIAQLEAQLEQQQPTFQSKLIRINAERIAQLEAQLAEANATIERLCSELADMSKELKNDDPMQDADMPQYAAMGDGRVY